MIKKVLCSLIISIPGEWGLLDVICNKKGRHYFATCHLGEVQWSGMH